MKSRKIQNGAGASMLGVGMAFLVVSMSGQPAFIGVAMAFVALGIALLANVGKCNCP